MKERKPSKATRKGYVRKPYQNLEGVHALSTFLKLESKRENLTYEQIAASSDGLVQHQALYRISNERVPYVEHRTLEGIAIGLGISRNTVYDVYLLRKPVSGFATQARTETRKIELPVHIWETLEAVARQCQLPLTEQLAAMIYYHEPTTEMVPTSPTQEQPPGVISVVNTQEPVNNDDEKKHLSSPPRAHSNRGRIRRKSP